MISLNVNHSRVTFQTFVKMSMIVISEGHLLNFPSEMNRIFLFLIASSELATIHSEDD